ncbi:MAG TPA: hypothetical protein VGI85_00585 [Chthoniobacterales bacterium]
MLNAARAPSKFTAIKNRKALYCRVAYHLGGKRHRLNFRDLEAATNEAEAKASQLSRGTWTRGSCRAAIGSFPGARSMP